VLLHWQDTHSHTLPLRIIGALKITASTDMSEEGQRLRPATRANPAPNVLPNPGQDIQFLLGTPTSIGTPPQANEDDDEDDEDYIPQEEDEDIEDDRAVFNAPLDAGDQAVVFALSPALAARDILDYNSSAGAKIYKAATEALPFTFNGEDSEVMLFLQALSVRAYSSGWLDILEIPIGTTGRSLNLLTHYAQISHTQLVRHARSYHGRRDRRAQSTHQMFECIQNSISSKAHIKVMYDPAKYVVGGSFSGTLFLKALISSTNVDTRSTTSHIRRQMAALPTYMSTVGSDITQFNAHVKQLRATLMAHGQTSTDLLDFLFAAYKSCSDPAFVDYINNKKDAWDEGSQDISVDQLMRFAEMKMSNLQMEGRWKQPSKATAMAGEIKEKNTKDKKAKGKIDFAWKKKAPAEGKPQTRTFRSKTYHWCPHHQQWCVHKPSECTLGKPKTHASTETPAVSPHTDEGPRLQLSPGLLAAMSMHADTVAMTTLGDTLRCSIELSTPMALTHDYGLIGFDTHDCTFMSP